MSVFWTLLAPPMANAATKTGHRGHGGSPGTRFGTQGYCDYGHYCRLQHRPAGSLQVAHVDMFLEYRELTWSGAGTDRTRTTHEQRIRTERVGSSLTLLPGQVFKEHTVLVVPEAAAPSFRSTDNEVAWVVGVEMEIDGFPTLRYEKGLWIN